MNYLIALVTICAFGQLVLAAPADKVDCSNIDTVLDDLGGAQGMTSLNDKYKIASNVEDFNKRCQEMMDGVKMLRKYNKDCFTSLTQQVLSAMLTTRGKFNEASCKAGADSYQEGFQAAKCIQDNALESVKTAERKIILSTQAVLDANIEDEKLRLRRGCCAVAASKNIFLDATKEKCAKHEKVYTAYVDSYTSEAMGLICPDAEKLECDKLEPLKTDGVALKSQFFLLPIVKLVKTLDHQ